MPIDSLTWVKELPPVSSIRPRSVPGRRQAFVTALKERPGCLAEYIYYKAHWGPEWAHRSPSTVAHEFRKNYGPGIEAVARGKKVFVRWVKE